MSVEASGREPPPSVSSAAPNPNQADGKIARTADSTGEAVPASETAPETLEEKISREVREQIASHRESVSRQSYLQRAVGSVYNPAATTLHDLIIVDEELNRDRGRSYLSVDAERAKSIEVKIKNDREMLAKELKAASVTAGALTAAPLFVAGPLGWVGSGALNALNSASPGDAWQAQASDATLGAGKGLAFKGAFSLSRFLPGGFVTRTALLGPAQRGLNTGLSRQNYVDPATGALDITGGLLRATTSAFNPFSLGADMGSQAASAGSAVVLNYLTAGALGRYPLLGTMAIGGIYGFNSSVSNDVRNHLEHGAPLTASGVVANGLEMAAVSTVAAVPGGLMGAHDAALRRAELIKKQNEPPAPGDHHRLLTSPDLGGDREYLVHVPQGYKKGEQLPIVVVVHGTGGSAQYIAGKSQMNQLADKFGFIAVYPQGNNVLGDPNLRVWHIPARGLGVPGGQRRDVAAVAGIIDDVQLTFNGVQPGLKAPRPEVHIGGMSAGATMAGMVAKQHPEKVDSMTIVAGVNVGSPMLPGHKNMLIVHNSGDRVISYDGSGLLSRWLGAKPVSSAFNSRVSENDLGLAVKHHHLGETNVRQATGDGVKIVEMIVKKPTTGHNWDILGTGGNAKSDELPPVPAVSRLIVKQLKALRDRTREF
jgi:poly(3-hydroxybutyrate) depolymerase